MATKDITDKMVCQAYMIAELQRGTGREWKDYDFPYETLQEQTGECFKVCYRAMEWACDRGYIEHGVSLSTGRLTDKGRELLNK